MTNNYEKIYALFKAYIESNSIYDAKVEKVSNYSSAHFPTLTLALTNNTDSNDCSLDKIESYDNYYFTINIYTQNKKNNNIIVSSQVINNELIDLTIKFFSGINMKRTSCVPASNIDTSITRTIIQYQCSIGNAKGDIVRR